MLQGDNRCRYKDACDCESDAPPPSELRLRGFRESPHGAGGKGYAPNSFHGCARIVTRRER